jgi:peroxiredoxin
MKAIRQYSENFLFSASKFTGLLLIGLSIILFSCQEEKTMDPNQEMNENPDDSKLNFELKALSGETLKLQDYQNKVVVLFFFGNACPSCKASAPSIQTKLQDKYGSNSNFALIGLDQWDGNSASVQSFKSATGVTFPLLLMASPAARAFSTTYDRLLVVDKSGKIAFMGKQLAGSDLDAVVSKVEELLK